MHNPHTLLSNAFLMDQRRPPPSNPSSPPISPISPVVPQPQQPRRNLTVPQPRPSRLNPSPPPHSPSPLPLPNTAAAPVPDFAALSRQSSARSAVRSGPTEEDDRSSHDDVHPLQGEIDRLSALCDQHELKFRSSKASFEHRVFSEFPSVLGRLSDLDSRAEKATADLYSTMNAAVPKLDARLASLLDERAADVETMRERTTPWTAFIADVAEVDTGAGGAKLRRVRSGRGRIGKIERVRVGEEREDVDSEALAMFERWADEVETHLTDEIARLERQIGEENRRRSVIFTLSVIAVIFLIVAGVFQGVRVALTRLWWGGV